MFTSKCLYHFDMVTEKSLAVELLANLQFFLPTLGFLTDVPMNIGLSHPCSTSCPAPYTRSNTVNDVVVTKILVEQILHLAFKTFHEEKGFGHRRGMLR
jgi:hypothetical protein